MGPFPQGPHSLSLTVLLPRDYYYLLFISRHTVLCFHKILKKTQSPELSSQQRRAEALFRHHSELSERDFYHTPPPALAAGGRDPQSPPGAGSSQFQPKN